MSYKIAPDVGTYWVATDGTVVHAGFTDPGLVTESRLHIYSFSNEKELITFLEAYKDKLVDNRTEYKVVDGKVNFIGEAREDQKTA